MIESFIMDPVEPTDFMKRFKQWKAMVFQNCPAASRIRGGPPFCLIGGYTCSFLRCPRNIYGIPVQSLSPPAKAESEIVKTEQGN